MMMREVIDRKEDFLLLDRCQKGVKIRVDLLTIAAKIAIISDISTCKGLLFCELTHESGALRCLCLMSDCLVRDYSRCEVCFNQSATTNELPPTKMVSSGCAQPWAARTAEGTSG